MRKYRRTIIAISCALSVSGCAGLFGNGVSSLGKGISSLGPSRKSAFILADDQELAKLSDPGKVVYKHYRDSYGQCMTFKEGLTDANAGLNAGSDWLSLALTAVSSVVSPISANHALATSATVVTGLKTSVNKDVTTDDITNLTVALEKIYFVPMANVSADIVKHNVTAETAPGFLLRIDNLAEQCSLDSARVYIRQNLSNGEAQTPDGQPIEPPKGKTTSPGSSAKS